MGGQRSTQRAAFAVAAGPVAAHRVQLKSGGGSRCASVVVCGASSGENTQVAVEKACPGCGREEGVRRGCDGTGRVVGGLGAVLTWWPIKAYRPCDELAKRKVDYKRAGQSLEEIAFGRKGNE